LYIEPRLIFKYSFIVTQNISVLRMYIKKKLVLSYTIVKGCSL